MKKISLILFALATVCVVNAQKKNDPVLFTYGNASVTKGEFLRMYTKNLSNQKPDYSEKALKEYLTLYSRFKMKVAEANQLKMDTLQTVKNELGGYKNQLSKSYLTDKEVLKTLSKEAYARMQKDIRVAHILISTPRASDDTMAAYKKADSLYRAIMAGASFETLAAQYSEDKESALRNGDIGYITALQVVYPFETVAYETPVGKIAKPFKTLYGYHIVKKIAERPARGDIKVSQIMIAVRKSEGEQGLKNAKEKIDEVYKKLKKGEKFESLVATYSEDQFSKNTQGELASFGVGQMVPEFEDAAFALKKPGDYSEPILTSFGYHIIRLNEKRGVQPFDSISNELAKRIEKDGRMEMAKKNLL
ncbi:MAG: peptidylprolyl isomerase [Chitinophagaceae bacterium]